MELGTEVFDRPMRCQPHKKALELQVLVRGNSHRDMKAAVYSPAVTDAVARKAKRPTTNVEDVRLGVKELVTPLRCHQHEEATVPDIVNARNTGLLAACSRPLRDVEAVPLDEFRIDRRYVLPLRHRSRHVEEMAVLHQVHRDPLHEPCDRRCLARVYRFPHLASPRRKVSVVSVAFGTTLKAV